MPKVQFKRNNLITLRLNDFEYNQLIKGAEYSKQNFSDFIRIAVLEKVTKAEEEQKKQTFESEK